jgi:NACalpha-BTF3-like transcription factor
MPKAQEILNNTYKKIFPETDVIELSGRSLEGKLKIEGFKNLKLLDCSNNNITHLEVTDCPSLEKIFCSKNELVELKFGRLGKLIELRCEVNKLTDLNLSKRSGSGRMQLPKLEKVFCDSDNLIKNTKLKNRVNVVAGTRNVLLIGRTGEGKSSLANTLLNKNNNFEEVFKESINAVSETRDIQEQEFEYEGIKYKVIDTIGLGDTKLKPKKVIYMMGKGCKKVEDGLTQVFFVVGSKFTPDQVETYKILKKVFFDEGIVDYITIIRTSFINFREEKACFKDVDMLLDENKDIAEVINSCKKKIIHVDNPSVSISGASKSVKMQNELNKEHRKDSREKLLRHLERCKNTYRPERLGKISKRIEDFAIEEIEDLRQEKWELKVEKEKLEREKEINYERIEEINEKINEIKEKIKKNKELMEKDIFESILIEVRNLCKIS